MKKITIILLAFSLILVAGCSSTTKSKEEFTREVYYDLSTEITFSEDTVKTEAQLLAQADLVAKIIPNEGIAIVSAITKDNGGGEELGTAYIFDIVELYFDNSELYNDGDRIKALSFHSISNYMTEAINLQVGQEYIVFLDLYSTDVKSKLTNHSNNLIIDSVIGIIPCDDNNYIINNGLTELLALTSNSSAYETTINETLEETQYLSTEILPLSEVINKLSIVTEDDMTTIISTYLEK